MSHEQIVNFLVNHITDEIVKYIIEDSQLGLEQALKIWYSSTTYELLLNPDGGLQSQSPAYVYELLKNEMNSSPAFQESNRKSRASVEKFVNSCPKNPQMTDEEIAKEVKEVRYREGNRKG